MLNLCGNMRATMYVAVVQYRKCRHVPCVSLVSVAHAHASLHAPLTVVPADHLSDARCKLSKSVKLSQVFAISFSFSHVCIRSSSSSRQRRSVVSCKLSSVSRWTRQAQLHSLSRMQTHPPADMYSSMVAILRLERKSFLLFLPPEM